MAQPSVWRCGIAHMLNFKQSGFYHLAMAQSAKLEDFRLSWVNLGRQRASVCTDQPASPARNSSACWLNFRGLDFLSLARF